MDGWTFRSVTSDRPARWDSSPPAVLRNMIATRATTLRPLGSRLYSLASGYETIIVDPAKGNGVALITLNRPKALNALCDQMVKDLSHATGALDANESVGAIVITGSQKAFAAGADIKEMSGRSFSEVFAKNMFSDWAKISKVKKPTIAAIVSPPCAICVAVRDLMSGAERLFAACLLLRLSAFFNHRGSHPSSIESLASSAARRSSFSYGDCLLILFLLPPGDAWTSPSSREHCLIRRSLQQTVRYLASHSPPPLPYSSPSSTPNNDNSLLLRTASPSAAAAS